MRTDEQMTYYIENEVLYVTYDGGENFVEVPDGYEKVCTMANGSYNELLPYNSYLVTEEFTAFVTHNSLLYSTDKGETWKESQIYAGAYRANVYVSMTDNGCYVTLAVDRSLGSDYYQTFCSQDLETWTACAESGDRMVQSDLFVLDKGRKRLLCKRRFPEHDGGQWSDLPGD